MPKKNHTMRGNGSLPAYTKAILTLLAEEHDHPDQIDVLLGSITELASRMLRVDHASIWLWDQTREQLLVCRDAYQQGAHAQGQVIDVETMPLYFSKFWHQPYDMCSDYAEQIKNPASSWHDWQPVFSGRVGSALHVRLVAQGQLIGILCLYHARPHRWTNDEITFALLMGDQVGHILQQAVNQALQRELTLASTVFEVSRDSIIIMDAFGQVVKVNPAFSVNTGFLPEDILGQFYPTWVNAGGQTEVDFDHICPIVKSGKAWQGELYQRRKDGRAKAVWQTMLSVTDDKGEMTHYIAIETDLSDFKEAQARVHFLSYFDSLTGMANRSQLDEYLVHQLGVGFDNRDVLAVFAVDVDDFKRINLSLGHTLGDQLLVILSRRLERVRHHQGLWARLSGDEFVFAIRLLDVAEVKQVIQEVQVRFSEPFALADQQVRLTASMGVAIAPQDAADSEHLLRASQSAMRAVKQSGGNGTQLYAAGMNAQAVERLLLENQLAQAVSEKQLVLHYQPQVCLQTGRLIGLEALVRWNHPSLGLVLPGKFISLAEETGLIEPIGDWVLEEACRQQKAWIDMGITLVPIAVNVSAPQFMRQSICDRVQQLLTQYALPAHLLELELTERIVMHDPSHVRSTLESLAQLGVILSLDDFGTGYSSLSYLQKFPLDKLKIDMSFVRNIAHSKDDMAIANAIIQLGKTMELTVIAEGVETVEQKRLLKQAGCEEGQGYYYAKPLSVTRVTALLQMAITPKSWPYADYA